MKNYVKLNKKSLFRCMYFFIDHEKYLADKIFIDHKLRVHFGKEYVRDKGVFRIIVVSFPKKREDDFLKCMEELVTKMQLMNYYKRYKELCEEVIAAFDKQ